MLSFLNPFKSSLNGMTAKQLGDAYEQQVKKQWTQPVGFIHSLFEVGLDVLKRTAQIGDSKSTVDAIQKTNIETVAGPVRWDGKGVPPFAAKNVAKTPLVGGQWRLGGKFKYDLVITSNETAPQIPVGGDMQPIA